MQLNLPILDLLADSQSILIAGAGGGFDVYAGLPIYFTLREMGKTVHLANYSFTDFGLTSAVSLVEPLIPDLLMATHGKVRIPLPYLPESFLSQWFEIARGESVPVWMFANTGGGPLASAYRTLVDHLKIDAIILVDGGVDSIMRGEEEGGGSLLEDTITLAAVSTLTDIPVKIQACIGFGTEVEEGVCHYNALENMAALAKAGAFYGSCALTNQMEVFHLFESACRYVWEQPEHHKSHISTRIIPAVHGEFGQYAMYPYHKYIPVLISPLMSLYWFFDAHQVIAHNKLIDVVVNTTTKREATNNIIAREQQFSLRPRKNLPY